MSDKKFGVLSAGNSSLIDHYEPEIVSATDYYPLGMVSRVSLGSGRAYRFGFNGKENDNDVKGYGGQQDYGMRIYDPRVGRFLSVDPLSKSYPWYTTYQFAGDNPIKFVDLDGSEPWDPNKYINSDAPNVDPKYRNVNLHQPKPKLVGAANVAVNTLNAGCIALGVLLEPAAAMEYGHRVKNKEQAFPLTHDNIKYTAGNALAAPAMLAREIKNDPTNEQLWGEAVLFAFPLAKSIGRYKVGALDPMIEKMSEPLKAPLPSLSELPKQTDRTFNHFTNIEGVSGITGINVKTLENLKVGESMTVKELGFGQGTE